MRGGPSEGHPFRCPECAAERGLHFEPLTDASGAYLCPDCGAWFPVEHGIADFAPPGARDDSRWRRFWQRHRGELQLRRPDSAAGSANVQIQRDFFDHGVGDYDEVVANSPFWRAHDAIAIESWVKRVPPNADVIDLGAGSGRCTVALAERLSEGSELVGVDISFEMLRAAGRKLDHRGTRNRVCLAVGDCTQLGFLRPRQFDIAFSYGLLHHLDDPEPVFRWLSEIMRDNANVLIHDNNDSGMRGLFDMLMRRRRLWEAEHEGHPTVALDALREWASRYGFQLHARTSVFVPPHVCERLSFRSSRRLLALTDGVAGHIPVAARHGGVILAEAFRCRSPIAIRSQPRAVWRSC
jgi:ubiquinone/menaquinone biosynthesis C-methylase UbiE/uncharacterized protein YbaR (Trm112 family)